MSQSHMTPEPDRLLAKLLEGELPEAEREQLNRLLRDDASLRRLYREYMVLDALLRWEIAPPLMRVGGEGQGMAGSPIIDLPDVAAVELPRQLDIEPQIPDSPFPSLSTTRYPPPTTPFVESWAFSCMVSTVILCVMLLGFWAIKVTHHQHIATAPSQSVPSDARPEMVFVGRITGAVGVKWSDDPNYLPPPGYAHVSLGRKYILSSGLLEITYDSGAKVILEGPCTYEVESTSGGYLALGKLTAKVEKKRSEVRGQRSDHYPLSTTHYPLFSVRTPTAVVTDLGTEFGVEVGKEGSTTSHVFRGKVKVLVLGGTAGPPGSGREVILGENESARVQHGKDAESQLVVVRGAADPNSFVRPGQLARLAREVRERRLAPLRRWQTYSRKLREDPSLVAYYTFESRGRERTRDPSMLPNVAATGEALDARIEGPRWTEGRFPGKFALRFSGPEWGDRVELPQPERFHFTGSFSLAVWFKNDPPDDRGRHLLTKGNMDWRFCVGGDETSWRAEFSTGKTPRDERDFKLNTLVGRMPFQGDRWHLVVAVFELDKKNATKRLYVDGRLGAECFGPPRPISGDDRPVWLGNNSAWAGGAEYNGLIDEVAIFSRALSDNEIEEMFVAGEPPGSDEPQSRRNTP